MTDRTNDNPECGCVHDDDRKTSTTAIHPATVTELTGKRFFLADDPTPHGQPLTALPLIASLIDGELVDGQEHHATLRSVRDRS
jgi:hypothetical protein